MAVWFGAWNYSENGKSRRWDSERKYWGQGREPNREGQSKNKWKKWAIGDDSDETINNVSFNVETLDEETKLIIAQLNRILTGGRNTYGISFKQFNMNTLNRTTAKVNRVIELIETKNITETNNLIKAASIWVADQLGLKKYDGGKKKDLWWKRRIEEDIKQLKKDIKMLERVKKGQIGACKEGKAWLRKSTE